jgi:hypothetical protein
MKTFIAIHSAFHHHRHQRIISNIGNEYIFVNSYIICLSSASNVVVCFLVFISRSSVAFILYNLEHILTF